MEHTPKPWHHDGFEIFGPPMNNEGKFTNVADLDLMVSAPDLLEQRDELLAALEAVMAGSKGCVGKAEKAIAKAKGDA